MISEKFNITFFTQHDIINFDYLGTQCDAYSVQTKTHSNNPNCLVVTLML